MRKLWLVFPLLLSGAILAHGQTLVGQQVLAGSGNNQPTAVATDSQGFVYVAGITTSGDFPISHALESQLPQGALEVSNNGAAFVNSGLNASNVTAVAASSDGMLVIAAASTGAYRSTDGGVTWKPAADTSAAGAAALAVDPVNSSNAYAILQNGAIYRSSNGGVNWQAAGTPPPTNQAGYGLWQITIDPQTPATLYACGNLTVYRSTDGAQSWQPLSIPFANGPNGQFPVSAFALAPSQPNVLYVAAWDLNYGAPLFKSTDSGSTWMAGANGISVYYPNGLAVDPTNPPQFGLWTPLTEASKRVRTVARHFQR
jgi:hypothetical protein